MNGAAAELEHVFGSNIVLDAEEGRLPWKTPAMLHNLSAAGRIGSVVIMHIGDNGVFSEHIFDLLMGQLKDVRRVVVVNVKVPRKWEEPNNKMLASAVQRYPNTVLLDWQSVGKEHPEFFWKDGIHLRPEGAKCYAILIAQAASTSEERPTVARYSK